MLGRVDGNSSYNSMGDNWGSHRSAQVKLKFLKTYIFKRPLRDACLCMGELQAPPAPHFVFLITL